MSAFWALSSTVILYTPKHLHNCMFSLYLRVWTLCIVKWLPACHRPLTPHGHSSPSLIRDGTKGYVKCGFLSYHSPLVSFLLQCLPESKIQCIPVLLLQFNLNSEKLGSVGFVAHFRIRTAVRMDLSQLYCYFCMVCWTAKETKELSCSRWWEGLPRGLWNVALFISQPPLVSFLSSWLTIFITIFITISIFIMSSHDLFSVCVHAVFAFLCTKVI